MTPKLGINQRGALESLRHHGTWSHDPDVGLPRWVWGAPAETKKILDGLVRRGFATVDESGVYRPKD
jgi:hypothetical protein